MGVSISTHNIPYESEIVSVVYRKQGDVYARTDEIHDFKRPSYMEVGNDDDDRIAVVTHRDVLIYGDFEKLADNRTINGGLRIYSLVNGLYTFTINGSYRLVEKARYDIGDINSLPEIYPYF